MTGATDPLLGSVRRVRERSATSSAPEAAGFLRKLRNPSLYVTRALDDFFRSRPGLGSSDRTIVADLVYAYVRWKTRLLRALSQSGWRGKDPEAAGCALLLTLAGYAPDLIAEVFRETSTEIDLNGAAEAARSLNPETAASTAELSLRVSLPEWIVRELGRQYGFERARAIALAMKERAPAMLRTNLLAGTRDDSASTLAKDGIDSHPARHSPWGLELTEAENVSGTSAFRRGLVEPQDEASQLVALLSGAEPGMTVVDACAGAGGKSLAMAAMMRNRGTLIATDVDGRKLAEAQRRGDRAGVEILTTATLRGGAFPSELRKQADLVLVDAPCTGSGTWRRIPDGPDHLSRRDLSAYTRRQAQILERTAELVKPGGRLVYATCSLFEVENQSVVTHWLASATEFTPRTARELLPESVHGALEDGPYFAVTPQRALMDGFFAAVFERAR